MPLQHVPACMAEDDKEALRAASRTPFFPLTVPGDRQYYLSFRHATVLDKPRYLALIQGGLQRREAEGLAV